MKTTNEPKFCVNCRWCVIDEDRAKYYVPAIPSHLMSCGHPSQKETDIVNGQSWGRKCDFVRGNYKPEFYAEIEAACGPDAKLWEEKV